VFNNDYFTFMLDMIKAAPCEFCDDGSVKYGDVMETTTMQNIVTATEYALNILSHARDKERTLRPLFEYLQQCYSRYLPACWWFMHALVDGDNPWLSTLLFDCTSEPIRKAFSELVCHVVSIVTPYEYPNFLAQETVMVPMPPVDDGELEKSTSSSSPSDTESSASPPDAAASAEPKMQPLSRYVNTVPRFMMRVVVLLDIAPRYWRRFQQFFFIMHQLASSGWEERAFLIKHEVIGTMIDMYLGAQSPIAQKNSTKGTVVIGDKFSAPDLHHFLGCLSKLVCCCNTDMPHLDKTLHDPIPPTQLQYQTFKQRKMQGLVDEVEGKPKPLSLYEIPAIIEIAAQDRKCLLQKALYNKALASGHNAPAIADILCHWSYGWENYTSSVCEITAEGFEHTTPDAMAPYELVVRRIFALDDGHMLVRMQKLLDPQYKTSMLFFAEGYRHKVCLISCASFLT
jgi:hypothetical protein